MSSADQGCGANSEQLFLASLASKWGLLVVKPPLQAPRPGREKGKPALLQLPGRLTKDWSLRDGFGHGAQWKNQIQLGASG
jgi:hypothetical protein